MQKHYQRIVSLYTDTHTTQLGSQTKTRFYYTMRIYSLLIALAVWANMWAIPAYKNTIKHTQKSGKELTLVLMGDEYLHYYLNQEDQKKMELKEDGDYHVIDERDMQDRVMAAERRRAASAMRRSERLDAGAQTLAAEESNFIGKKKGIVLLVDFQDIKMLGTHEQSHTSFNKMFNEVGYSEYNHIGSVHDYFLDQSYGRFDLEFDVVGPLTVANNCEYYGGNDNSGSDLRPATMVIEACKLAHEQGINFADYDWDGDGKVEQVFVIYAGYGENYGAASTTIWPHEWTLSSAYFYGDGTGRLKLDGVTNGSLGDPMFYGCIEYSYYRLVQVEHTEAESVRLVMSSVIV